MLPMTVLRRFDCVLAPTKEQVLAEYEKRKGGKLEGDALDTKLNGAAGQRFHNHSPLDFEKLKGDPDNIAQHLVSYYRGFSKNVREIFDFFEFENEIERMVLEDKPHLLIRHGARAPRSSASSIFISTFHAVTKFRPVFPLPRSPGASPCSGPGSRCGESACSVNRGQHARNSVSRAEARGKSQA